MLIIKKPVYIKLPIKEMEESENNKNETKEIKEVEENERENIPIDKALDIQINYLQSSVKNILYGLIANEPEVEEPDPM